ncbi:hypothetical protein [Kitasatospora cinereorecta]|uniref:Uncharacterized protein n=1 Tax=Kitasatospora cinereorecta TaxID=285560 RepID=A0ABW0VQK4_9ACTN
MLLTWIAEIADEPLTLNPADRREEWGTNTWLILADDEDRAAVTAPAVVAAFERTAGALRTRIRATHHTGPATFYVWHDVQADQLRCCTGSVPADDLPFGGAYTPTDDLHPIVERFLTGTRPNLTPFPVWVRAVGTDPTGR